MGFCKIACTALFAGVGFVGTPALLIVAAIFSSKFGDNTYEASVDTFNDAVISWNAGAGAAFRMAGNFSLGLPLPSNISYPITLVTGMPDLPFYAQHSSAYPGPLPLNPQSSAVYWFQNEGRPALFPANASADLSHGPLILRAVLRGPQGPFTLALPAAFLTTYKVSCAGDDDDGDSDCFCPLGWQDGSVCHVQATLASLCLVLDPLNGYAPAYARRTGAGCAPQNLLPDGTKLNIPSSGGCLPATFDDLSPFQYALSAAPLVGAPAAVSFANFSVALRSAADPFPLGLALTKGSRDFRYSPDGLLTAAEASWAAFSVAGVLLVLLLLVVYTPVCDRWVVQRHALEDEAAIAAQKAAATAAAGAGEKAAGSSGASAVAGAGAGGVQGLSRKDRQRLLHHPLLRDISIADGGFVAGDGYFLLSEGSAAGFSSRDLQSGMSSSTLGFAGRGGSFAVGGSPLAGAGGSTSLLGGAGATATTAASALAADVEAAALAGAASAGGAAALLPPRRHSFGIESGTAAAATSAAAASGGAGSGSVTAAARGGIASGSGGWQRSSSSLRLGGGAGSFAEGAGLALGGVGSSSGSSSHGQLAQARRSSLLRSFSGLLGAGGGGGPAGGLGVPLRDADWIRILERAPPPPGVPLELWERMSAAEREETLAADLRRDDTGGWTTLLTAPTGQLCACGSCVCRAPLACTLAAVAFLNWLSFLQNTFRGCCPELPLVRKSRLALAASVVTTLLCCVATVIAAVSMTQAGPNGFACAYSAVCGSGLSPLSCQSLSQLAGQQLLPGLVVLRNLMVAACVIPVVSMIPLIMTPGRWRQRKSPLHRVFAIVCAVLFTAGVVLHWAALAYYFLQGLEDQTELAFCALFPNASSCKVNATTEGLFSSSAAVSVVAVLTGWLSVALFLSAE